MWLKKKGESDRRKPKDRPPSQQVLNEDTAARVKAVLAQIQGNNYTVLAKAESDSSGKMYEIRLGQNHAVFCTCKGWQYSKNGTCKHLERFKRQVKPFVVKSEK